MSSLFPAGIATGEAFYDRTAERSLLSKAIQNNTHTVLLAPRRYGKTSLVTQVVKEMHLPYCAMDFLLCSTPQAVETKILQRVGELLEGMLPKTKHAALKVLEFFKDLKPEIVISTLGQKIVFHPSHTESTVEDNICDLLLNLDRVAQKAKQRVIVFMDEFQQIGQLRDMHAIEAAIRHAAERSRNVSYIFSGSHRHLLLTMFSQKNRPFYRLCAMINLQRISEADHIAFIQKQANKKWGKPLAPTTISKIIAVSECHPFYVNIICHHFWQSTIFPTAAKIQAYWLAYVQSQRPIIAHDLGFLSNNQKIILRELATTAVEQPYSKAFVMTTALAIASLKEGVLKLKEKDFIYEDEQGMLQILDPAVKTYIREEA